MNVKARKAKKQVNVEKQAINLLSKEELSKKIEVVEKELRSYTWRELETNGENDEGLKDPVIEEEFDPDRTILSLSLEKKQAITSFFELKERARTVFVDKTGHTLSM